MTRCRYVIRRSKGLAILMPVHCYKGIPLSVDFIRSYFGFRVYPCEAFKKRLRATFAACFKRAMSTSISLFFLCYA